MGMPCCGSITSSFFQSDVYAFIFSMNKDSAGWKLFLFVHTAHPQPDRDTKNFRGLNFPNRTAM
jgi:hypothetical protein